LRSIGVFSNSLLLWGIAGELAFAAALIYAPPLQDVFGTRALPWWVLVALLPCPLIVWGADELFRARERRRAASSPGGHR